MPAKESGNLQLIVFLAGARLCRQTAMIVQLAATRCVELGVLRGKAAGFRSDLAQARLARLCRLQAGGLLLAAGQPLQPLPQLSSGGPTGVPGPTSTASPGDGPTGTPTDPPEPPPGPTSSLLDPVVSTVVDTVDGLTGGALSPVTGTVEATTDGLTDTLDDLLPPLGR